MPPVVEEHVGCQCDIHHVALTVQCPLPCAAPALYMLSCNGAVAQDVHLLICEADAAQCSVSNALSLRT